MAASSGLLQGVGVCVQECGGLRGWGWVQRESGGDRVGVGRERPKWKRVPHTCIVTHVAICQMLTSNYLVSRHIVYRDNEWLLCTLRCYPLGLLYFNSAQLCQLIEIKQIKFCHFQKVSCQGDYYWHSEKHWKTGKSHSTSTSSFLQKNALASSEESKNKLMQAFQELDKMTHTDTSADYWKPPLLSRQYADKPSTCQTYAQLLVIISLLRIPRSSQSPQHHHQEERSLEATYQHVHISLSQSSQCKNTPVQCFEDFQPALWKVLDGEIRLSGWHGGCRCNNCTVV